MLCRILTELKLLGTPVGVIVLSAGVGNDVVGWVLLALCVALVNAGSGIVALWVLLVAVGYILLLVFAVRPGFIWVLKRTGSLQNGPTQSVMALTILMVLVSAFFTSIIGIHPIFGAFIIGVICPHDSGFAIKVTEKVEDLVSVLLLPLYFALSGLSTNLGLLNNGITWAYVIGIIAVAFSGKMIGGTLAAKMTGMVWRESFTIGSLMSCKGLVELIVLNIGLQAGILSVRTFTMFVVMALVTTFATTPLVSVLYPHWYQVKIAAWRRGEIDWDGNKIGGDAGSGLEAEKSSEQSRVHKVLAYLRLDSMSGVMALVSLLSEPVTEDVHRRAHPAKQALQEASLSQSSSADSIKRPLQVYGVRLTELTERESSVMRVSEVDEYSMRDPVVNAFRTFGQLKNVAISGQVAIASESSYANMLTERAIDAAADLLLIPWSETGGMGDHDSALEGSSWPRFANGAFSHFVLGTINRASCSTAVFVDNGFGHRRRNGGSPSGITRTVSALSMRSLSAPAAPLVNKGHHLVLPFFGSEDDKLALRLVLQMARDPTVTATVVHFELSADLDAAATSGGAADAPSASDLRSPASTTGREFGPPSAPPAHYAAFFATLRDSLPAELAPRVMFDSAACTAPVAEVVSRTRKEVSQLPKGAGNLGVRGRHAGLVPALRGPTADDRAWADSEAGRAMGVVAGGVLRDVPQASVLVLSASDK